MELKIQKTDLALAVNRAQGSLSDRSLSQIGLKAENDTLTLVAADRVLVIYSDFSCQISHEGTLFVPAKIFSEVVKELPQGIVILKSTENFLIIEAGEKNKFVMKIPLLQDHTFRAPPVIKSDNSADIPARALLYGIHQVMICVANDSPKNYGSVAYLHKPHQDQIRLVGTDGFRLSYSQVELATSDSFLNNGICLSKRALAELSRMCEEGFESLRLTISADQSTLVASAGNCRIFIRLSSVQYPQYTAVLPKSKMNGVLIKTPEIQSVTKRVLLAADSSRSLRLKFSGSSLRLNSKTMGSSEGHEDINVENYHGSGFDVAVNGKYLNDVFATIESENLALEFNQENNEDPIVIVPRKEPNKCRSQHVLVPIKQGD
jgi:DNA polymerase III subunit beta